MKLPCLVAVSIVTFASGCGNATAPSQNVTALYVLESINGQSLPATFSLHPGWIATVSWATVNLDAAGNATMAERRRTETPSSQFERTAARITDYEITGERIEIGPPCPLDAPIDCVPKRIGLITASTLTLSGDLGDPHGVLYLYRLAATDD
jgi:hypothetical protein